MGSGRLWYWRYGKVKDGDRLGGVHVSASDFGDDDLGDLDDDDLGLVCSESDSWGADIFVSLHCNAFNTEARGTETLYKSFNGQRLANDIQSQIIRSINTVDRGVKKRDDLWVLNGTDATAVLVEMAFIDNEEDHTMLSNDLDTIVRAIARGITDYAGGV